MTTLRSRKLPAQAGLVLVALALDLTRHYLVTYPWWMASDPLPEVYTYLPPMAWHGATHVGLHVSSHGSLARNRAACVSGRGRVGAARQSALRALGAGGRPWQLHRNRQRRKRG